MNYSARERFAQLMQSQGQGMAAPMQGTRSSQMMSAVRMANGGAVSSLPTLQEMADPNYQFQGVQLGASAPFTQFNPTVPMFSLEAPAFGGMQQSTYDWTAPTVQAGSIYQPQRQDPVMTESTSAYRPVDATTVMDQSGNIPNVPVDPYAPYVAPVAQTQPQVPVQQAPVATPSGVASTSPAIPQVITAEERARREAQAQRQAEEQARAQAEAEEQSRQAGIQAELERRRAAEEAQRQAAAQAEAQRLQQEEAQRIAAQQEAQRQAAAEQAAREQAAAAQAEQDRIAAEQAAQAERDRIAAEASRADEIRRVFQAQFGSQGMEGDDPGSVGYTPPAPRTDIFGNPEPDQAYWDQLNREGA